MHLIVEVSSRAKGIILDIFRRVRRKWTDCYSSERSGFLWGLLTPQKSTRSLDWDRIVVASTDLKLLPTRSTCDCNRGHIFLLSIPVTLIGFSSNRACESMTCPCFSTNVDRVRMVGDVHIMPTTSWCTGRHNRWYTETHPRITLVSSSEEVPEGRECIFERGCVDLLVETTPN